MNCIRLLAIAVFSVLLLTSISNAQDPDNRLFGLSSDDPAGIYSINPATGNAVLVATLNGGSSIVGLSFIDGTFYGSDLENFPGAGDNFSVGSIAPDGVITFLNDQNGSSNWWGLASDDCDRRVLYSVDNDAPDFPLVEQRLDGSTRTIGTTGVNAAGLAFDDTNRILYALEGENDNLRLFTISTNDGDSELIGPSGLTSETIDLGLAYDEINKVLYLVEATDENLLYTLDTETGQATLVGPLNVEDTTIDGLAWLDDCLIEPRPIPTLSEWGLIATAGVLGLAGLYAVRRRRAAV